MTQSAEGLAKALATKRQKAESYAQQRIVVDNDWTIQRVDPLNWEIRYKGKFQGYYGTIPSALKALPAKMLSEQAKGTLSEVLQSVEGIRATIEKAIP